MPTSAASSDPVPFVIQLIPMVLVIVPLTVFLYYTSLRKGRNPILFILLGLIPGVNILAALWLVSQTDEAVKDQINRLRDEINSLKEKK